jgi:hypothetical protein
MDRCLSTTASFWHREWHSTTRLAPNLSRRGNEFAFDVRLRTPNYEAAGTDQSVSGMNHDVALSNCGNSLKGQFPVRRLHRTWLGYEPGFRVADYPPGGEPFWGFECYRDFSLTKRFGGFTCPASAADPCDCGHPALAAQNVLLFDVFTGAVHRAT